ncbi:D-alanyl-D-alanine carboxypeptidase family protein [Caenispirillum bisanense]|uniref:D-alanyl-D-alanine carboxypeptidase family protein n=1 Tax=Caenispirillum bisanense TaxID=414052 RepID=UPI0031DAFB9C
MMVMTGTPLRSTARQASVAALAAVLLAVALPGQAGAIETKAREALLLDFHTETVMFAKDADVPMPPSSMSKLMTSYVIFDLVKQGRLKLDDVFTVSENAWRKGGAASGGSTMFLEPNSQVAVQDLLRGIIIQSGNDACIVAAENIAGSEEAFADLLNRKAKEIGLTGSHFTNSTGLPDPDHYMTARDLATLAKRLILDFPDFYPLYKQTEFTYNGITQHNRNPLLYMPIDADGLKTGHTSVAGYGLTASAVRGDRRLILVVNGLASTKERGQETQQLMDWGFRSFENRNLFKAGDVVENAEVWLGEQASVPLVIDQDLRVTMPRRPGSDFQVKVVYDGPVPAPVQRGQQVARLVVDAPEMERQEYPLYAGADVAKLGFFGRMMAAAKNMVFGYVQPAAAPAPAAPAAAPAQAQ